MNVWFAFLFAAMAFCATVGNESCTSTISVSSEPQRVEVSATSAEISFSMKVSSRDGGDLPKEDQNNVAKLQALSTERVERVLTALENPYNSVTDLRTTRFTVQPMTKYNPS
eukprot:g73987.t1